MTLRKQLTGLSGFSKEVPLVITGFYSANKAQLTRYQIENEKEEVELEHVNAVRKSQQEQQGLRKTIKYLSNIHDQLITSNTKSNLVQVLEDSDIKIAIIDFSQIEDAKDDDEIDLMFAKHKDQIAGADRV